MSATSPLLLLAIPATSRLLAELAAGPRSLAEIRRGLGLIPETTIRGHMRPLVVAGVVEQRRHGGFPGSVDYRLTPAGEELRQVEAKVATWLAASPQAPIALGTNPGKRAVRILVEGWRAGIVRALSKSPLSLTELGAQVSDLSYPAVERRLSAMRSIGLVDAQARAAGATPLAPARWLRLALVPLSATWRWQCRWQSESATPPVQDVETAILLALPKEPLRDGLSGICQLLLRMPARGTGVVHVSADLRDGTLVPGKIDQALEPTMVIDGPCGAWVSAVVDGDPGELELHGATDLAASLLKQMQRELLPQ